MHVHHHREMSANKKAGNIVQEPAMHTALAHAVGNPLVVLYILQGLIDATAAALYRHRHRSALCLWYSASAFLHWGFGLCHLMNLG